MQEPFFAMRYQAPNRTSKSHRELGSGIFGGFFTGSSSLGEKANELSHDSNIAGFWPSIHYPENPWHITLFSTEQHFRLMLRVLGRKIGPELKGQLMLSPLVNFLNSCSWKVSSLTHHSLTPV
jgi:hypothetical protein